MTELIFMDFIGFEEIQPDLITMIDCFFKTGHTSIDVTASGAINPVYYGYSSQFLGGVVTYTTLIGGLIFQHTAGRVDSRCK